MLLLINFKVLKAHITLNST